MTEVVKACRHKTYVATHSTAIVNMHELSSTQLIMKLDMKCRDCGAQFTFKAKNGFSTNEPTTNEMCTELVIPVEWPAADIEDQDDAFVTPPTVFH